MLVPGRNSCDLHSAGKELWDVLCRKSLACSGRRQLFLLCLHQYLNTSAHPADSLMVEVILDIFLPQADFQPPKPPENGAFADAAGRRCYHQPHCIGRSSKGTQMQRAHPQNLWHSPELGCRATLQLDSPKAAFLVEGGCSPETRACGIRSSPGAFHGNHGKEQRQAKGKNK